MLVGEKEDGGIAPLKLDDEGRLVSVTEDATPAPTFSAAPPAATEAPAVRIVGDGLDRDNNPILRAQLVPDEPITVIQGDGSGDPVDTAPWLMQTVEGMTAKPIATEETAEAQAASLDAIEGQLPAVLGAGGGLKVEGVSSGAPVQAQIARNVARVVHLASQALPAAGAFTSQAAYTVPEGVTGLTFWITYTRGAIGGQPALKLLQGNGTEEGPNLLTTGVSTPGNSVLALQATRIRETLGPAPTDGNPLTYCLEVELDPGVTTVRLVAAEHGVTATPGTIAIALAARTGGA
jgi:hypothetical protein